MFACFVSLAEQEKGICVVQGTAEKQGRIFQCYLHRRMHGAIVTTQQGLLL